MSDHNENPLNLQQDNGRGHEGEGDGARNGQFNQELLYVDEPERLFRQRMREAAENRRRAEEEEQAIREEAERHRREQQQAREQLIPDHNRYHAPFAPINNQPPPPMNQGYAQQYRPPHPPQQFQQYMPQQPVNQGNARQLPRQQYREEPSMKDMSISILDNQSWCINTNAEEEGFEIKTNIVHYLPKFAGLPGEVAIRHLKEFEGVCKALKPYAAPEDKYKLNVFPFSLTDIAKSWFLSLPSGSIQGWDQMKRKFMEKFYPAAKANQVRRELSVIKQGLSESTYEYLERFIGLEESCCNLGIPDHLLVQYLLDGLRPLERMMLDAAAGGSVMNLSATQVRELIRETAESARFRDETTRREDTGRMKNVSQVDMLESRVAEELKEIREMMRMMVVAQGGAKACELCTLPSHRTDECPSLQHDNIADVNAKGGYLQFNNQPIRYGLAANGYRWKQGGFLNQQQQQQPYQPLHQ